MYKYYFGSAIPCSRSQRIGVMANYPNYPNSEKIFKNNSQYILQGLQELSSYSASVWVEDSLMKVLIDQFWGLQKHWS